jgi:hypothetical protein
MNKKLKPMKRMIMLATAIFLAGSLTVMAQSQDPVNKKKETPKMTAQNSSTSHMANAQAMPMQSGHHQMMKDQQQANAHSNAAMNNQQQATNQAKAKKEEPTAKKKEGSKNVKSSKNKTESSKAKNEKKMKPKDHNEPANK